MPETPNQASSRHRRANWVARRTLRLLPRAVGDTAEGEPVYEIRSVRLLLDGTAANFVRLAECSRCGRELPGPPVLTPADLDRPLEPMVCTDCIPRAGVSTVSEPEGGARLAPAALSASDPEPAPSPLEVKGQVRLDAIEGHLRAVTDKVNELGRVARAHKADLKERTQREEASAAALRGELAALRASTNHTRAELERLAGDQAERERRLAESAAPAGEAGAGHLREEVAQLARLVEAQRGEVGGLVAAVGESQVVAARLAAAQATMAQTLGGLDPATVAGLITTPLAEAEGRLAQEIAGQWSDLETAIEGSVNAYMAGVLRANEELAGGQAALEERIDALALQVTQATTRLQALLGRLDALEAALPPTPGPLVEVTPDPSGDDVPPGGFLDSLDRQLEAAARRLAARSQAGAGRGDQ